MVWLGKKASASILLVVAAAVGVSGGAWASHLWLSIHYKDDFIYFYNGAANSSTGTWRDYFEQEARTDSNAWSPFTDVHLSPVSSHHGYDGINCYSGYYGSTGWSGLAEICASSGDPNFSGFGIIHYGPVYIRDGHARLNQSYLDSSSVTTRKHVACQEIGHLLSLDHNHASNVTCMNDWISSAPQPDAHDKAVVNSIY